MHLTLGNFKILKLMNLASNFRYPLWFPLLCRKWVWLSWSSSSLEWKSTANITAMFYSLSRYCQSSSMLQAIRIVFQQDTPRVRSRSVGRRTVGRGRGEGAAAAVPARPWRRLEVSPPPPMVRRRPIRLLDDVAASNNVTFHPLRRVARYFGPSTAS